MLISHEYFSEPFNPEAVEYIRTQNRAATRGAPQHQYLVIYFTGGGSITSLVSSKSCPKNLDQLERDINEACTDTAKLLDPEADHEYNGETALPAACSYTITCKDGPLIKGNFNPREDYQVEIPAIVPQTLVLNIIPTRLDS